MPEIFNAEYALLYDLYSSRSPRAYEYAVQSLIQSDEGIQKGNVVIEVGCGTGNSTKALVTSNPNLKHLYVIEPSIGFLKLANYKFGKEEFQYPDNVPQEAKEYIEAQRQEAMEYSSKVSLLNGKSQDIPIPSAIADRLYCCESFHWFAFPSETASADVDFLGKSLKEIHRVLKPTGRLLFDSNGHLFDFDDHQIDGRSVNAMHFTNHPIFQQFEEHFVRISGSIANINVAKERDKLHFMFNLPTIEKVLKENGFDPRNFNKGYPFPITLLPYSNEDIIRSTIHGAKMSYFNHPEMAALSDEKRNHLIDQALQLTLEDENNLFAKTYYETFICFTADKITNS